HRAVGARGLPREGAPEGRVSQYLLTGGGEEDPQRFLAGGERRGERGPTRLQAGGFPGCPPGSAKPHIAAAPVDIRDEFAVLFGREGRDADADVLRAGDGAQRRSAGEVELGVPRGQAVSEAAIDRRFGGDQPRYHLAPVPAFLQVVRDHRAQQSAAAVPRVHPHPGEPAAPGVGARYGVAGEGVCVVDSGVSWSVADNYLVL